MESSDDATAAPASTFESATPSLDPGARTLLLDYLVRSENRRLERAEAMWGALTEREQLLVRQATVMAFVRGTMHNPVLNPAPIPGDRSVIIDMLLGCDVMWDIYPDIAGLGRPEGWNDEEDEDWDEEDEEGGEPEENET